MASANLRIPVHFMAVGALVVLVPSIAAQGSGYTWETYIVSPSESWEKSTPTGTILRTNPYLHMALDETGTLSLPYKVAIRFPGSFSCLNSHEIEVTARVTATDSTFGTASWDPPSKEMLKFTLPAGSHPNGVTWSEQEGPTLRIRWDLARAPGNATVTYYVVAFPVPAQGPTDCQPKGAEEGVRYLSRINVTQTMPPSPVPDEPVPEPKGRLGFGGGAIAMTAIGLAMGSARRRS